MSRYDYLRSKELEKADEPFNGLIMAAMRRADTDNLAKLKAAWPEIWEELHERYYAAGGYTKKDIGEWTPIDNLAPFDFKDQKTIDEILEKIREEIKNE